MQCSSLQYYFQIHFLQLRQTIQQYLVNNDYQQSDEQRANTIYHSCIEVIEVKWTTYCWRFGVKVRATVIKLLTETGLKNMLYPNCDVNKH